MDDIQLILYILFLIGYFIFKLVTGKGKTRPNQEGQEAFGPGHGPHAPRHQEPRSFEEILEEMVTGERREQKSVEAPAETYEENLEKSSWYDDEVQLSKYEKAVASARSHAPLQKKIENSDIKMGEVEDLDVMVQEEDIPSNPYFAMFKDLESTQKAVVMSEIINRKY